MKKIQRWQDLEEEVNQLFVETQRHLPLAFHRFYDSKSAGSFLPAQPADFLVTFRGKTTLVEAKFSEVHDSLRSCFSNNVDAQQLASAKIWNRAEASYLFLFYPLKSPLVEVWDGAYCFECRSKSTPLKLDMRRTYYSIKSALAEELEWRES